MGEKSLSDLFIDKEYLEFYRNYKHEQDNNTDMLTGNINRMCVCKTKEELYIQYFNATARLQELLRLRLTDFSKWEELGYGELKETDR